MSKIPNSRPSFLGSRISPLASIPNAFLVLISRMSCLGLLFLFYMGLEKPTLLCDLPSTCPIVI
uniref:Uncharacterized protein n=1 Tax=Arundo donax TaxID=35708 RepID=A0A0A9DH99_ARUDO